MTDKEIIDFFGTPYRLAKLCGFKERIVYYWRKKGVIPDLKREKILQIISKMSSGNTMSA
ncbi:MAG: Cro/Cl family transcriptional regulator [Rickettsiales bacterium]|jgi:hypothetical protein|nr:Cro/Cl family transcriptional regulator [Rickettsiales bacterium]